MSCASRARPWADVRFAAIALLIGCTSDVNGSDDESGDTTHEALVSNDPNQKPPIGPTLPVGHTIPGLADDQTSGAVQSGDVLNERSPDEDLEAWADRVADPQLAPPALRGRLQEAIDSIDRGFLFGDTVHTFAYEPERARWIDEGFIPPGMDEIRQRGARLYCAAKEAYRMRQNATVRMGKKSLASFSILGAPIDLMAVEPSVALGAPQKFASGDADGAQAFSIPIKVGTKFTPISFLPFLTRDQEQLVTLTTADGASLNAYGESGTMLQTATHADAFTGSSGEFSQSFRVPLFTFPIGSLDLTVGYNWGMAACSQTDAYEQCQFSPRQQVRRLMDSGVWGYPGTRRGGATSHPILVEGREFGTVNDGPWTVLDNGNFVINGQGGPWVQPIGYPQPMWQRARQNNDKSIEVQTAIGLSAGAALAIGPTWGPFTLAVDFGVELVSNLFTTHRIREQINGLHYEIPAGQEFTALAALPQTDLSVTPDLRGDFGLQMDLVFRLGIDLPVVGWMGFERTLINAGVSTPVPAPNQYSSGWPEHTRLRIGTAMSWDGALTTNGLVSHWPQSQEVFAAQPQSLEECLGAPSPERLPNIVPPPCAPEPQPETPPVGLAAEFCFAAPLPSDALNTVCEGLQVQFASEGRTSTQDFRNWPHAVRVLDEDAMYALRDVMAQCATEVPDVGWLEAMFEPGFVMCDGSGLPYDADQVVQKLPDVPADAIQPPSECR